MKRFFTRTFLRFLVAFLAIIAISCALLVITSHAEALSRAGAAAAAALSFTGLR